MNIYIKNENGVSLDTFIVNYLIPETQKVLYQLLDYSQCSRWTKYFKTVDLGWLHINNKVIYPSAYDIIINAINSLEYVRQGSNYIVQINMYKNAPKSTAKLSDICYLINYGNMEMPPYTLFTDVFKGVANNVWSMYNDYEDQGGLF